MIGIVHENPFAPGYSFHVPGQETRYSEKELDNLNKIMNLMEHYRLNEQTQRSELVWALDSLWIIGTRAANSPLIATDRNDMRASRNDEGIQAFTAWGRSGGDTRRVFFPSVDHRWGLEGVSAEELGQAVELVEYHLKMPLAWSPGHVGQMLIKQFNNSHPQWLAPANLTGMPYKMNMPHDIQRKHFPDFDHLDSSSPLYLHIYDKRFMYGGACTSVKLGEGSPEYRTGNQIKWNERYPGLWKLPSGMWKWTPSVQRLISSGFLSPSDLTEAWCWTTDASSNPRYHQTLRAWAECLWAIDCKLTEYPLARNILKKIRTQSLGWFAHQSEYSASSAFYRPDFWAMIVDEAANKMEYKIDDLYNKYGIRVVWVNVDEIGVISNEPDPRLFQGQPHPLLAREHALGGFRHRYSLLLDDEVLYALNEDTPWGAAHDILLAKWKKTGVPING